MKISIPHFRLLAASALTITLAACGGSSIQNDLSLGGSVSGLTGDLVLTNNLSNTVSLSAGTASYSFPNRIPLNSSYSVTVKSQPASLSCIIENGSGIAGTSDINNVNVKCTPNHTLGGTVSGLTASGLVLADGSNTVSVAANSTSFIFSQRIGEGTSYGVTVLTQPTEPTRQTCTVIKDGTGYMGTSDITSVQVSCI